MIFLLLVLGGMLSLAYAYIYAAQLVTDRSYAESVLFLAGRSVLTEFDADLKDEYGIIAYRGSEEDALDAVNMYAGASFAENDRIHAGSLSVDLSGYCLLDTQLFRKEAIEYTRYALVRGLLEDTGMGTGDEAPLDLGGERVLRNSRVINALPSGGTSSGGHLWEAIKHAFQGGLTDIFSRGTDNYLFDLYIMRQFRNAQDQDIGRDTFFQYEAEYILEGHLSDQKNRKAFRNELLLVRNAANMAYLYTDPEKMEELAIAAELLAPGIGAPLVQVLLAEAWALAEAENDVLVLEHGKKLPLFKTKETWAVSLDSILEDTEDGYIDISDGTGLAYRDYLKVFLFFMDGTTKALRVMDLIQINMQGLHDRTFMVRDLYNGFAMHVKVRGREYDYVHMY